MNKLNFKNQQKTLKIHSSLCDSSRTGIISLPVRFEENFDFLDAPSLAKMLQILETKDLIQVHYADYPDNFNIYALKVTPKGLDLEPQISYDKRKKMGRPYMGICYGRAVFRYNTIFSISPIIAPERQPTIKPFRISIFNTSFLSLVIHRRMCYNEHERG